MECGRLHFVSVLILCGIVCAKNIHRHQKEDYEKYKHHSKLVQNFQRGPPCSEPKQTLVHLNEIVFDKQQKTNEITLPNVTVLYRCESCTGCDEPGHYCTAKSQDLVKLTFLVSTIDGSHREYRIGQAQNHTSCWCQPEKSIPK